MLIRYSCWCEILWCCSVKNVDVFFIIDPLKRFSNANANVRINDIKWWGSLNGLALQGGRLIFTNPSQKAPIWVIFSWSKYDRSQIEGLSNHLLGRFFFFLMKNNVFYGLFLCSINPIHLWIITCLVIEGWSIHSQLYRLGSKPTRALMWDLDVCKMSSEPEKFLQQYEAKNRFFKIYLNLF